MLLNHIIFAVCGNKTEFKYQSSNQTNQNVLKEAQVLPESVGHNQISKEKNYHGQPKRITRRRNAIDKD